MPETPFLDAAIETFAPSADGATEPLAFGGDLKSLPGLLDAAETTALVDGVEQLVTFGLFVKNERKSPTAADAFLKALAAAAAEPLKKAGAAALATRLQKGFDAFGTTKAPDTTVQENPGAFNAMAGAATRRTNERALELLKKRVAKGPLEGALAQLDPSSLQLSPEGERPHLQFKTKDGEHGGEKSAVAQGLRDLISDRFELASAVIGRPV